MELFLLCLLALTLPLFLLLNYCMNHYAQKSNHHPPGPRGLPLIGNMHQFDTSNTHIYLFKLYQKYGPLVSLKFGSVQVLVISSASAAKQVFKDNDLCVSNKPASVGSRKISYNGRDLAYAPYNDYWRNMRKICNLHLFSSKRSQSFHPVREEEVARMIQEIRDRAAAAAADYNIIVNLSKTVKTLASSVMLRITFGKRFEGQENDLLHWLIAETQRNLVSFFAADYFPLIGCLIDRLSGALARLELSFSKFDAIYQQLIDEHIHATSVSTQECSILDILLQMKTDSSEFTFDNIKAILTDVIVAGSDTSAAVVIWAMTLLVKNPRAMKKVQQEVRDMTEGGKKGFVYENDIHKLVYLKAVVKEAMRLQPPSPLLMPRVTTENCVISGYDIEAKTHVYVNAYAIGRDPEFWENCDEFLPERFINNSIDFKGQDYELIPFGAGRRICPGISMGVATTELMLANLVYSFDWELPPGMEETSIDMDTIPGITTHKKNDLCLVPKVVD